MLSRILCVLGATVALGIATASAQSVSSRGPAPELVANNSLLALQSKAVKSGGALRVIVLLREGRSGSLDTAAVSDAAVTAANYLVQNQVASRTLGSVGRVLSRADVTPIFVANVTPSEMAKLAADPMVDSISEDTQLEPHLRQSLPIIGMTGASGAHAKGATGKGRAVAILDTGVNKANEFLKGKIISEACYNSNIAAQGVKSRCPGGATSSTKTGSGADCVKSFSDGCGHGTHVAGISAGKNPTVKLNEPITGVAPAASIIAINVFSKVGAKGITALTSDIVKALDRVYLLRGGVANRKIDAVNMSLGGGRATEFCDNVNADTKAVAKSINRLVGAEIAVVVSSGNDGFLDSVSFPACIKNATTVGASTKTANGKPERLAFYTNSSKLVDVLAPGGDTQYPFGTEKGAIQSSRFSGYEFLQGTSMAAPHVAGVFAAIRSAKGCSKKTVAQIETALKVTGTKITDFCTQCTQITKPRVNVARALANLKCGT